MPAPGVTRIDMDVEIEAIKRGECGMCRVTGTHIKSHSCENTPAFEKMKVCKNNHVYCKDWFTKCPICFPGDTPSYE